jgi:ABC-type multidrug transport system fused ATPase/permease subunit
MVCFVFGAVLMVWYVLFSILLLVLSVLPYYIVFIKFTRSTFLAQKETYKGKVKTHKYIHRKNQSTIRKLYHENSSRNKTYHTMRTVPKTKHNIPREQLQNRNIPYHENSSKNKTYHTMRTAPKTKHTIP